MRHEQIERQSNSVKRETHLKTQKYIEPERRDIKKHRLRDRVICRGRKGTINRGDSICLLMYALVSIACVLGVECAL